VFVSILLEGKLRLRELGVLPMNTNSGLVTMTAEPRSSALALALRGPLSGQAGLLLGRQRQKDQEFKAGVGYIASLRSAWAPKWNPISKDQKQRKVGLAVDGGALSRPGLWNATW
jgi:hypothetical protein